MKTKVVNINKIIVNGKEYASLDEVPPEYKKLFENLKEGRHENQIEITKKSGKTVNSYDELPEEIKKIIPEDKKELFGHGSEIKYGSNTISRTSISNMGPKQIASLLYFYLHLFSVLQGGALYSITKLLNIKPMNLALSTLTSILIGQASYRFANWKLKKLPDDYTVSPAYLKKIGKNAYISLVSGALTTALNILFYLTWYILAP